MDNPPIRIVILDNHALVRAGLALLIERKSGMLVVGEAGNLSEGLQIISNLKPDIILLELNLAEIASLDVISSILKASDRSRLILVTSTSNPLIIQQAIEEGVVGVIFKTQSPEILIKAIEKVQSGEVWLERSMIANVLSRLSRNSKPVRISPEVDSINELSEREKQIVRLIGQGYKNKRISTQLCISETTVRHHLTSIYNKLGVSDRLELLVYAHRYGLVKSTTS
jgi:two-component system, NarL family, nitrate/nitrite response regulator NarL